MSVLESPMSIVTGEGRLLPHLLDLLTRSRRITPLTLIAHELAWHGRRVDVATLSSHGRLLSAYELKLRSFGRVLEQAIYNKVSFDRSWVVVDSSPTDANRSLAAKYGIGIIVVSSEGARVHTAARRDHPAPELRREVRSRIATHGLVHV